MEALLDLLVFAFGAGVISGAVIGWQRRFPRRAIVLHAALVVAFFSQALLTNRHQVATDIAFLFLPYSDQLEGRQEPKNPLLIDTVLQILPYRSLVRERLLQGEIPFWSHELGTGQPLLGNGQSAVFSPVHLLALPLPPLRSLTVTAALTVFLSLVLTHALMIELGASLSGCLLAAVAVGFSAFSIVNVYVLITPTVAWLPGILLAILMIRKGARHGVTGLAICVGGAGLSGHPSSLANVVITAAAVALFLLARRTPVSRTLFLARCFLGALLGAGLAAVALVPLLQALPESHRYDVSSGPFRQATGFEVERLKLVASPLVFGHPKDRTWRGPRNYSSSATSYAGALPLALALAGVAFDRRIRILLVGGGMALLLAIWRGGPREVLPVLLRDADRLQFVWVLAISIAAGLALTVVAENNQPRRTVVSVFLGVLGAVLLLRPSGPGWQQLAWMVAIGSLAFAVIALVAARRRPATLGALTVCALIAELFLLHISYHPALPPHLRLHPPPQAVALLSELAVGEPGFRILGEGYNFRPGLPALYGLWDPRGNDPMRPVRPFRLLRKVTTLRQGFSDVRLPITAETQPLLNLTAVRWALTRHDVALHEPWRLAADLQGGRIWANPDALPLFFAPRKVLTIDSHPAGESRVVANTDFQEVSFVAQRDMLAQTGTIVVDSIEPTANGFRLDVEASEKALLTSSVSYSKHWKVWIDGRAVRPLQVNTAFIGFHVPPGTHSVELEYKPRFWSLAVISFAISTLAVISCLFSSRLSLGRTKRDGRPRAAPP